MIAAVARALTIVAAACLCLALFLLTGCRTTTKVEVTYGVTTEERLLGDRAVPVLQSVSVDPESYGRSCTTIDVDPSSGAVSVVHAVDASSDYGGLRLLAAVVPDSIRSITVAAVTALVKPVTFPFEILGSLLGMDGPADPPMEAPSALSACSSIFEE